MAACMLYEAAPSMRLSSTHIQTTKHKRDADHAPHTHTHTHTSGR
jgi:hypothetical protein